MFIDVAKIELKAGKGGDGSVSFRREKYEPSGGPYGGDGGDGGSVIVIGDESMRTLMDFRYKRKYTAENGEDGRSRRQYGKKGEDLILKVPVGTLIKDAVSDRVIVDVKADREAYVIVKGGRGGRGNAKFATATRQAPRFAEPGKKGEQKVIKLELKLIADVGLVGLPNVGKSSILSIISNAKPKIANYHFTTLTPNLGVVEIEEGKSFVIADIPGLIEGASQGSGLGHDFLRHIERTRLLVHVLDAAGVENRSPIEDFYAINKELFEYNEHLKDKPQLIVLNKTDIEDSELWISEVRQELGDDYEIIEISAATSKGIQSLKYKIWEMLSDIGFHYETYDEEFVEESKEDEPDYFLYKQDGVFHVEGPFIDDLTYRTNFEDYESISYFHNLLKRKGIVTQLESLGVTEEDTVIIGDMEFEFRE